MNTNTFNNKSVLITGHTGFKGSWLSAWLLQLGAKIIGVSNTVPTDPAHYELIKHTIYEDHRIDIRDEESIFTIVNDLKPQFVFHLAAQPIVTQVNDFQKGAFGISSGFGAFDLMTLFVVLISMVGFNRKNPAVGVGIMVSFIGAMGYFGIIEPPTIMMGILAVVVVVSIGQVRKNR